MKFIVLLLIVLDVAVSIPIIPPGETLFDIPSIIQLLQKNDKAVEQMNQTPQLNPATVVDSVDTKAETKVPEVAAPKVPEVAAPKVPEATEPKVAESTQLSEKAAMQQMISLFEAITQPISDSELKIIRDVIDMGANVVADKHSKAQELEINLFQTEASVIKKVSETPDKLDSDLFSKNFNISLNKNEKNAMDALISMFSNTQAPKAQKPSHDELLGLTSFLDLENLSGLQIFAEFGDIVQKAFADQMNSPQSKNFQMNEPINAHSQAKKLSSSLMPESDTMEENGSMNPNSMNQNQQQTDMKLSNDFNMNIHENSEMDNFAKHANTLLMNSPQLSNKMEGASIEENSDLSNHDNEKKKMNLNVEQRIHSLDAMQLSASQKTVDAFDFAALEGEEKEENGSPKINSDNTMQMPESMESENLVDEMEKNVKITQIVDHSVY